MIFFHQLILLFLMIIFFKIILFTHFVTIPSAKSCTNLQYLTEFERGGTMRLQEAGISFQEVENRIVTTASALFLNYI